MRRGRTDEASYLLNIPSRVMSRTTMAYASSSAQAILFQTTSGQLIFKDMILSEDGLIETATTRSIRV